jgi:alanine-glyoxylate transaminase/serine-glyoxylate transaminase/serine-pyruvate transaminase
LSLISRHLGNRPVLELNTPFSIERHSGQPDDLEYTPLLRPGRRENGLEGIKMAKQPEHPTLLVPGPIEFDDDVLHSMSHYR